MVSKQCAGKCPKCGNRELEESGESYGETEYCVWLWCEECGTSFCEVFQYAYTEWNPDED